jgi:hypothetical protein
LVWTTVTDVVWVADQFANADTASMRKTLDDG